LSTKQLGQRKSGITDISQNTSYVTRRGMACFLRNIMIFES